ncbi:MAG: YihY family inner membrane protein [Rhodospirillaceae bacterium]|jgi:membrane protein|nr:YihY family inner membrane protein [Rhodospirillaceae bacterium]MBT5943666.1 YihY family inner membrane protein [Rhodospirillaceae bacterium]MBT6403531.1 YihY family inner membrane protein [Rhodospirillaceae bacterium]MBT6536277.1 YihY family inner membrane protein [Rhodospirillaceae bacterium]MBT7362952.1 YihY family inner membrane protein [Rhodospirillaceae bacterium]
MDEKRLNRLVDELQFARTVVRRFSQDRVLVAAASLSYTSLLAIVPLFAIAFSVMMAFPVFDGMTQQLLSIVLSYTAPHIGGELETYVDRFVSNTSELTTLGVVWLAVTAVMLLSTIETAFNAIWRIEKPRPLGMRLIAYWTTLTLGPLLLGAGLSVSTAFAMNNFMPLGLDFGVIRNMALRMLPFLFAVGGFAILYLALPNRRVAVRYALLGALVAGILFEVLKAVFGIYLQNAGTFESVYGSLAALPVFLIWMYLVWAVVLFGAIVAATRPEWLAARRAEDFGPLTPSRALLRALQTIGCLLAASRDNQTVDEDLLLDATGGDGAGLGLVLARLQGSGYLARTDEDQPVLVRDLDGVTVADLYIALGYGPGAPFLDADEDPRWTAPLAELIAAYNTARDETMGALIKDMIADATAGGDGPRVVSDRG